MTAAKKPISVTLDPDLLSEVQSLVERGGAASVSAIINETLRSRMEREKAAERARAYVVENILGGEDFTEAEWEEAAGMIAATKARAAARRGAAA
ncbi:ribbon-helix-helix domain-containing protein [Actinacidiphila oryziradicis]|uniref:Ribbon-helix-helix protein, CopG family n=1 Tax=Actinacidiphila oryziradicis TaxID=2571141 RepID=A0A4U0S7Q6_9ACTN|nr:ribbon-helix-helix domain-containing protein [Actinacidiphila oryziradicis]TKA04523.1 ribbon-helix-helix protein, CopG family [Actinacidiphila oryziradicis]